MGERVFSQSDGQGLLQGWNSCCVRPEPLLIKDIKAEVNKQKLKIECPAQMKHNSDKMTIAPMSSQPCSKPNVSCSIVISYNLEKYWVKLINFSFGVNYLNVA